MNRATPIRACGKRYATADEAERSKAAQRDGARVEKCSGPQDCGGFHVRQKKTAAATGFSPAVKLAVRKRAGEGYADRARCEACGIPLGQYGGQVHHRAGRGSGGCKDAVINSAANAALLCGTPLTGCHGLATAFDDDLEYAGFVIRHGTTPEYDPRNVPIMHNVLGGSGTLVWLPETEARYLYAEPVVAA